VCYIITELKIVVTASTQYSIPLLPVHWNNKMHHILLTYILDAAESFLRN